MTESEFLIKQYEVYVQFGVLIKGEVKCYQSKK